MFKVNSRDKITTESLIQCAKRRNNGRIGSPSAKFSLDGLNSFNPLTTNILLHIETIQSICIANQLTGFYMMGNIGRLWVK